MTDEESILSSRAGVLRADFDDSFACIPAAADDVFEGVLAIRVSGAPYAVALSEVHGLFVDRKVVPLPARSSTSLGVTCLRTGIIAVYSLGACLGYPPVEAPMRWLISAGEDHPFALAFDGFDAYARVSHSEFVATPTTGRGGHIQRSAMIAGERRSIISLSSIAQSISSPS